MFVVRCFSTCSSGVFPHKIFLDHLTENLGIFIPASIYDIKKYFLDLVNAQLASLGHFSVPGPSVFPEVVAGALSQDALTVADCIPLNDWTKMAKSEAWLTGEFITLALQIIATQFKIGGCKDTLLVLRSGPFPQGNAIQIHFSSLIYMIVIPLGGNHWVGSARLNGRVVVWDILHNDIDERVRKEINGTFVP